MSEVDKSYRKILINPPTLRELPEGKRFVVGYFIPETEQALIHTQQADYVLNPNGSLHDVLINQPRIEGSHYYRVDAPPSPAIDSIEHYELFLYLQCYIDVLNHCTESGFVNSEVLRKWENYVLMCLPDPKQVLTNIKL